MDGFDTVGQMLEGSDLIIRAVLAILVIQSVYIWYAVIKFILTTRRVATQCADMQTAVDSMDIAGIRAMLLRRRSG
mgnify:FL=1